MMGDLSPHFSRREFACPCCGWDNIHPSVVAMLEQMRAWLNVHYARLGNMPLEYGLFPTSGCRCPKHNAAVGGAKKSWHLPRRVAEGSEIIFDPAFEWFYSGKKLLHFSFACDFQVKRREVCPECHGTGRRPAYHDGSDPIPGDPMGTGTMPCRRCNGENVAPWTLDIPAMEALNALYEPIHYGGWHLYDEECKDCGGRGDLGGWKGCPACEGTGRKVWIHVHVLDPRGRVRW